MAISRLSFLLIGPSHLDNHVVCRFSLWLDVLPAVRPITTFVLVSHHAHTPALTIQDVVCAPHVCPSEPRPPEAKERGGGGFLPGSGTHHPGTVCQQRSGRSGRCAGRVGSGCPPGETPAAAEARSGEVRSILASGSDHGGKGEACGINQ